MKFGANNNISNMYKYIRMEIKKKFREEDLDFYSDQMVVTKKFLNENHLKLTYQRQLISNLDSKHKDWSRNIGY